MNSNTQNTSNVNTGNEDYLDKGTFPLISSLTLQNTPLPLLHLYVNKAGHLN